MSWRSMRACARKTGENKNGDNFIALKNNYICCLQSALQGGTEGGRGDWHRGAQPQQEDQAPRGQRQEERGQVRHPQLLSLDATYIFTWHCFPRLELLNGKNQSASDRLSTSEDRRQTIETAFETSNEKIEVLEAQVRHHRNIKSKHVNVNNMWIRWISCMSFYRIKT